MSEMVHETTGGNRAGMTVIDESRTTSATPAWRVLVRSGALGPILFPVISIALAMIQPGYDIRSRSVSELARGDLGWIQSASFFVTGAAFLAFAAGAWIRLRRRSPFAMTAAAALLTISGGALGLAGAFVTDPAEGPVTDTGAVHNLAAALVFLPLILALPLLGRGLTRAGGWEREGRLVALVGTPLAIAATVGYVGFASGIHDPLYEIGGLIQRLMIVATFGWVTAIGWLLLRK